MVGGEPFTADAELYTNKKDLGDDDREMKEGKTEKDIGPSYLSMRCEKQKEPEREKR